MMLLICVDFDFRDNMLIQPILKGTVNANIYKDPMLLAKHPEASFGFIGSRTIDRLANRVEKYQKTQRYRIYKELVLEKIGKATFKHVDRPEMSGYLLLNKKPGKLKTREKAIMAMFEVTYNDIFDV